MEVTSADVEKKLGRMGAVCRILAGVVLVFCALFAIATFAKAYDVVRGIAGSDVHIRVNWLQTIILTNRVLSAASLSFICFVAFLMLADVGRKVSPFTVKQTKRLLLVAIAMVVFTISITVLYNESAIETIIAAALVEGTDAGFVNQWTIPFSYVVTTLFLFILYALFKYGVLLQVISDDTV